MKNGRKKILFHSDFSLVKTGFGRHARELLTYLYNLDKYDIVHFCCGLPYSNPDFEKTPWKSVGALPMTDLERNKIQRDPSMARAANYGSYYIDKVVYDEKPDVYIGCQDIWGVDFAIEKPWFDNINSVIWTTLDSLPILPSAINAAPKIKNYWIWSNFATKELHHLGHKHPITMRGIVPSKYFRRLKDHERKKLRSRANLSDEFVVGFVFRNQLRKSVPNLLEGFKKFKNGMPNSKAKLLLHTNFSEGWKIMSLAEEYKIDPKDILTTYICKDCGEYEVKPFTKQDLDCPSCGSEKTQNTTNVAVGVSETKLNEIYNLMDVYCHPFTSGGQEIPIQEAKLTELVTLVTNYSCGEDSCADDAGSIPLKWFEYREHQTEFKKASTDPDDICNKLSLVYDMDGELLSRMGKDARKWVLLNFDACVIGKKVDEFIENCADVDYDFSLDGSSIEDDKAKVDDSITDNSEWLIELYEKILKRNNVSEQDDGHKYWMKEITSGKPRSDVENFFRRVAKTNKDHKSQLLGKNTKEVDLIKGELGEDDEGRRIGFVAPQGIGDIHMSTSLFKNIKELYPDHNLYVFTLDKYKDLISGNPYIYKILPYSTRSLDRSSFLEEDKLFKVVYTPFHQRMTLGNYEHNCNDLTDLIYHY
jgi:glycosyltransferase involved in cell wall biosynthesis